LTFRHARTGWHPQQFAGRFCIAKALRASNDAPEFLDRLYLFVSKQLGVTNDVD